VHFGALFAHDHSSYILEREELIIHEELIDAKQSVANSYAMT
jgi:hypothetical protein